MSSSKNFSHLVVRNQLLNFDVWLEGFKGHRTARQAAGLHELQILRNADRPEEVFVLLETTDQKKTKEFIESAELSAKKKSLGVQAKPEYSFVESIAFQDDQKSLKRLHVLEAVAAAQAKVDQMDAAGFAEFFNNDGAFQFANLAPMVGPAAVNQFVAGFFGSLKSIAHSVQDQFQNNNTASIRGLVRYEMKDGRIIQIPYSSFYKLGDNGKFDLWQAFVDTSPLSANG